jgi:hypothetical protein
MEKQAYSETPDTVSLTRSDSRSSTQVVGTTNLYQNGEIRYVPMPTPDPKGTYLNLNA